MRKSSPGTRKPALEVIDEAVALLRRCPVSVIALYYVGAAPFVLAFLYFWTDMSRGAFAEGHLMESSLLVTAGFFWCKFWQTLFATHLLAVVSRRSLPRWTWRKLARVAAVQSAIQATGLFVLPVAALITVPAGVAYAFYQNAFILALDAAGEPRDGAALRREAIEQAKRWPAQNHIGLAILSLFWLTVFFNIVILLLLLPWLLRTLFGVETMFSRSLFSMFNTTLFAATAGLAYLCADPIFKAFYTVRCFHGRALATGEDLRIQLRALAPSAFPAIAAGILLFCAGFARGAAPAPDAPAHSAEIDHSISEVVNRPEFAWRAPREAMSPQADSRTDNFIQGIFRMIGRWFRPLKHWAREFLDWLGDRFNSQDSDTTPANRGSGGWMIMLKFFAWIFCAAAVCALGVIGWKLWLRLEKAPVFVAEPRQVLIDLNAEEVAADQLPEDAWMNLAREMIEKGDLRLALRAFYLAALAHLGEARIISIARYKSNREYQREVRRRRPAQSDLIATFSETVGAFERAWYGMHEVTADILDASQLNLERIRQS